MAYNFEQVVNRRGQGSFKWDTIGEEYLSLGVADMDFNVAPEIIEALNSRIKEPIYGYDIVTEEQYQTILNWYKINYNYDIKKEWIVFLSNIVSGFTVAIDIQEGEVIVPAPNYPPMLNAAKKLGKKCHVVELVSKDGYYTYDFDVLEQTITKETRFLLLDNPHNPVGRVYTKEELETLAEIAMRHNLIIVSDEIHCEIILEGKHIPFLTINEYVKNNSITFYGTGKINNLAGIPFSFAIIPDPTLRKQFEHKGYTLGKPNTLGIVAGIEALKNTDQWKKELIEYLKENRDYLEKEITRRFPDAIYTHVEGTYLLWVNFSYLKKEDLHQWIYDHAKLYLGDGKTFGDKHCVRINFATQRDVLKNALDRLEDVIQKESN